MDDSPFRKKTANVLGYGFLVEMEDYYCPTVLQGKFGELSDQSAETRLKVSRYIGPSVTQVTL
jgi:hypothetical protein